MSRVRFDEAVLAEHDKERGTRMVIDEPDTPYARSPRLSESESEDSHSDRDSAEFEKKFVDAMEAHEASEESKEAFKAKRKAHYNEMKVLREMRDKESNLNDEED